MENNQRSSSTPHLAKPVLCDGFLIPMTDFVLKLTEQDEYSATEILDRFADISRYAKFLKQPLKLEMFIPCDDKGNVLEYFPIHRFADNPEKYRQYKKAKEKVLFENVNTSKNHKGFWLEINEKDIARIDIKDGLIFFGVIDIIQDLLKIDNLKRIKLSQTALDSIFGKTVA